MTQVIDFSIQQARSILLRRGLTDSALAEAIESRRETVNRMIHGHPKYRSGKGYQRLRAHLLANNHADVVGHLDAVTVRSTEGRKVIRIK